MAGNVGNLGSDLMTLAELQVELLRLDAQEATKRSIPPLVVAVLGVAFVIGCCPLALLGLSWFIAAHTALSQAAAALIVAGGGLVLAAILFAVAYYWLRSCVAVLGRSREEFNRNLRWVKSLLTNGRR
jgi:hypothetical protein